MRVSDAARVVDQPGEVQRQALNLAVSGQSKTLSGAVRQVQNEMPRMQESAAREDILTRPLDDSTTQHIALASSLRRLAPPQRGCLITHPPLAEEALHLLFDLAALALRPTGGVAGRGMLPPRMLEWLQHPQRRWVREWDLLFHGHPARRAPALGQSPSPAAAGLRKDRLPPRRPGTSGGQIPPGLPAAGCTDPWSQRPERPILRQWVWAGYADEGAAQIVFSTTMLSPWQRARAPTVARCSPSSRSRVAAQAPKSAGKHYMPLISGEGTPADRSNPPGAARSSRQVPRRAGAVCPPWPPGDTIRSCRRSPNENDDHQLPRRFPSGPRRQPSAVGSRTRPDSGRGTPATPPAIRRLPVPAGVVGQEHHRPA